MRMEFGKILQMLRILQLCLCALLLCESLSAATNDVIRSARKLSLAVDDPRFADRRFEIEAILTAAPRNLLLTQYYTFWTRDTTGAVSFLLHYKRIPPEIRIGDKIRVFGFVDNQLIGYVCAHAEDIAILAHGPTPEPLTLTTQEVNSGKYIDQLVSINGTLSDAFRDDIDPHFIYAILSDEHGATYHTFLDGPQKPLDRLTALLGTDVTMTGICTRHYHEGGRKHLGLEIVARSVADAIRQRKTPTDPYEVPPLHNKKRYTNLVIEGDLSPKRVCGRVLAVWQSDQLLIETADGDISQISLKQDRLPNVGDSIEAVGTPETDLYHLSLSKAIWRKIPECAVTARAPERVTAQFMLTDSRGNREVKTKYSGHVIRITGLVQALPSIKNGDFRLNLSCDGYDVPVDFSPVPEALGKIENGSVIEVTGVCVIESENWRPQTPFPCAKGFSVILRTADDVRVVERPPWWTPARFCIVIAALLLALVGFIIRNRILKRIAREKLQERTRLAVELHDSMSQNLTGATMQIDTAQKLIEKNREKATRHLAIASKTLTSCREDLRNCIWDLRNHTLETADMNEAIRQTLQQHLDGAELAVRFNVTRNLLTDNTAHALLCILRELAVNAIRHGHATQIRVAGAIDGAQLKFSVADNGCGFDPDTRPGMAEGHFGLQGIQERLKQLGGSLSISSASGRGSKFTASLALPRKDKQL